VLVKLRYPALDMSIAENIEAVRGRIAAAAGRAGRDPAGVRLVGAVKGVGGEALRAAMAAGLTDCGENVVQEAEARKASLGDAAGGVTWHFIGHLQTNKAKAALRLFDIIESVDSLRLAEQLNRHATARLPILLEVNMALETSKFGFAPSEVGSAVSAIAALPNLRLDGLMTVAPAADNPEDVRPVFQSLRELAQVNGLTELSMGMTNDFEVAIEEGATMVRIGRAIFGERGR
jgi:pyridoxal phosphate enzyme (YggS family)